MHKQCSLQKGSTVEVAWIPLKFAKKGTYLELKSKDGTWINGWKINKVNKVSMPMDEISKKRGRSQRWYGNDFIKKEGVWSKIN